MVVVMAMLSRSFCVYFLCLAAAVFIVLILRHEYEEYHKQSLHETSPLTHYRLHPHPTGFEAGLAFIRIPHNSSRLTAYISQAAYLHGEQGANFTREKEQEQNHYLNLLPSCQKNRISCDKYVFLSVPVRQDDDNSLMDLQRKKNPPPDSEPTFSTRPFLADAEFAVTEPIHVVEVKFSRINILTKQ